MKILNKLFISGKIWPLGIAAFFAVFMAVNLAFVTVAFRNKPQLVSDNYYAEGYDLKEIAARKAANQATGWKVTVHCLPLAQADMPLAEMTVTEFGGQPCDSIVGSLAFYRPSDKTLDVPAMPIQFVGGGRYLIYLPRPLERGAWQAAVHLTRGKNIMDERISLFVDS